MTEPDDETQPHVTDPSAASAPPPAIPGGSLGEPAGPPPPASPPPPAGSPAAGPGPSPAPTTPPLRADPDRPADPGWREPPWIPPRRRREGLSPAALVLGLALIAIGLWFFVDRTLGIALPAIRWSSLWPILLIVLGAVVLVRSIDRSR